MKREATLRDDDRTGHARGQACVRRHRFRWPFLQFIRSSGPPAAHGTARSYRRGPCDSAPSEVCIWPPADQRMRSLARVACRKSDLSGLGPVFPSAQCGNAFANHQNPFDPRCAAPFHSSRRKLDLLLYAPSAWTVVDAHFILTSYYTCRRTLFSIDNPPRAIPPSPTP